MNRKILVPLATALAAGAVAVGSGATFSSQTGNTISAVTTGTLEHTNSKNNAAIFTLDNMKPGDTVNGTVTLKNTGSLPASFSLTEVSSTNAFSNKAAPNAAVSNLSLSITDTGSGATVYSGNFGGLVDGTAVALGAGTWAPQEAHTYKFSVTLDSGATNVDQNKSAGAVYQWNSTQDTTPLVSNQ
ncbi:hypothetical protein G7072_13695 [Nocardioides sp. HDW12B]|uniref:TasA family protein n=1 Tax=Nocardioides sp. HDW12B TaxID=2714939 RepID=UPI00140E3E31|nr:TasA family protein [Nocardioides sp. HDW12B]QIK67259.1 hypothetical protein G7072_13695 [Nocardioides sp. HDW12B]